MFRPMLSRSVISGALIFIIVCIGGTQWYSWHIRRKSAVELTETQQRVQGLEKSPSINRIKERQPPQTATQNALGVPDTPVDVSSGQPHPVEIADTRKRSETDAETEKVFGDYTKAELLEIRDWGRNFKAKLHQNYPDILEIPSLTPKEFNARYPTEAARLELKARQQEMRDFYLDEFRAFMTVVPAEIRASAIKAMRAEVARNWGDAAADDWVENLRQVTE
ncbi:hypothetical protein J5I95_13865 [Candidatus Poribacteria bacterium]|nr:hypothetical protein [Candidatus Poribacteria bacterium]